jgi:hypothetical protein
MVKPVATPTTTREDGLVAAWDISNPVFVDHWNKVKAMSEEEWSKCFSGFDSIINSTASYVQVMELITAHKIKFGVGAARKMIEAAVVYHIKPDWLLLTGMTKNTRVGTGVSVQEEYVKSLVLHDLDYIDTQMREDVKYAANRLQKVQLIKEGKMVPHADKINKTANKNIAWLVWQFGPETTKSPVVNSMRRFYAEKRPMDIKNYEDSGITKKATDHRAKSAFEEDLKKFQNVYYQLEAEKIRSQLTFLSGGFS